jgi:hypothetical protein
LLLAALALPPGKLVDRAIAVVDKEVITHSELLREARVALVMREGANVGAAHLPTELLADFLRYLVDQVIIANQARRLGGIAISEAEVDGAVETFAQRFSSPAAYSAFLRRFDIPREALRDILRRDLRNERYIEQRMRAWRIGDGGDSEGRYREALATWLRELRKGVELRVLSREGELELQPPGDRDRWGWTPPATGNE